MASSKEYLTFILDQLSMPDGITHRSMMGEYMVYYQRQGGPEDLRERN